MIQQVNKGERITAQAHNDLVDAVNQLNSGSVSNNNTTNARNNADIFYSSLFQVRNYGYYRMDERPNSYTDTPGSYTWMLVGSSLTEFKRNAGQADDVYILHPTATNRLGGKVEESWIKRNGTDKSYDGWIDLQYDAYEPVYGTCVALWHNNGNDDNPDWTLSARYFCVNDSSSVSEMTERLKRYVGIDEDRDEFEVADLTCIAAWTDAGTLPGESGSSAQIRKLVQNHTGAIANPFDKPLYVDDEITELSSKSIQVQTHTDISGNTRDYVQLYRFDYDEQTSAGDLSSYDQADILVRTLSGDRRELRYTSVEELGEILSGGGSKPLSGDSQYQTYLSSIALMKKNGHKCYSLFGFGDEYDMETVSKLDLDENKVYDYFNNGEYVGMLTQNQDELTSGIEVLMREIDNDGNATLKYGRLCADVPPFVHGDSDSYLFDASDTYSIQFTQNEEDPAKSKYQLYGIDNPEAIEVQIKPTDDSITAWMTQGQTGLDVIYDSEYTTIQDVGRDIEPEYKKIVYTSKSYKTMPFVHGDGDAWVGGSYKSIEHVLDNQDLTKTYYQLYGWQDAPAEEIDRELDNEDYTNLLGDGESFVVRGSDGLLKYKQIEAVVDINTEEIWDEINDIKGDITVLSGKIDEISGLSGEYWKQGGDYTECYGESIGDSNKDIVIDLDDHVLGDDWYVYGSFYVQNYIQADKATVQTSLTVGGELSVGTSVTVDGDVIANIVTAQDSVAIEGEGGVLRIGNTTLDEQQLQALLNLI